jgi:hypothetical protein
MSDTLNTGMGSRPEPDPTLLTTEALNREVSYLRTLLEAQVDNSEKMTMVLRTADEKFSIERDRRITEVAAERDRRLTEVATEREKALKIKEEADKDALRLDRELRKVNDEKAGARTDAAVADLEKRIQPLVTYVAGQQGRASSSLDGRTALFAVMLFIATIVAAISPHL